MKNLKFGVFCLGLVVAIVTVVSSLSAQTRDSGRARAAVDRERDGPRRRGSQLGVMVSDLDAKAATGGVRSTK